RVCHGTQFPKLPMFAKDRPCIRQGVTQSITGEGSWTLTTREHKAQELSGFTEGKAIAIHNPQRLRIVAVQARFEGTQYVAEAGDGFRLPVRDALAVGLFQTGEGAKYRILYRVNQH